jgi:hypothetical protein
VSYVGVSQWLLLVLFIWFGFAEAATAPFSPPKSTVDVVRSKGKDAPASDFDVRKTAAGVVRWFDFDTDAQLGPLNTPSNFGRLSGQKANPIIDTAVKASGGGSLRFDVPSQSGGNAAGSWYANFSPDLSVQFGENSEFFVQWRQRFNPAMVDTYFPLIDGGGATSIKQSIITTGDQTSKLYASCEAIGNVITSYGHKRFTQIYNSCSGSGSHSAYAGLVENVGSPPYDFKIQNATVPDCLYTQNKGTQTIPGPGCFAWGADEWMTFEVRTKLGPRNSKTNDFDASEVQLWAAREGGDPVLVIDWRPGIPGYFPLAAGPLAENQRFGKVWLLPYMTSKEPAQVHPLAQTWYDELIISRNAIAFPGGKAITVRRSSAALDIHQHGLTGTWYEPASSGQGFALEVYPDVQGTGHGYLQGGWFTFDVPPGDGVEKQRWYTFGGSVLAGASSATVPLYSNTGGNFNSPPITNGRTIGSVTISFSSCDAGEFTYIFTDGSGRSGTIPLSRLMPNVTCSLTSARPTNADFALSGNWYDPSTSGQGIIVEVNPNAAIVWFAWYTYAVDGLSLGVAGQRWFTGQGRFEPGTRSIPLIVYETTGGVFDGNTPDTQATLAVGSATLTLEGCGNASLSYAFTAGANSGRSGAIPLLRVGNTPQNCPA